VAVLSGRTRALLLLLLLGLTRTLGAAAPTEEQVKAVFVFNFSHFVDWPPTSLAADQAPFVICVAGNDAFGDRLTEVVQGEKIDQHPLAVRRIQGATDANGCQVLFVGQGEAGQLPQIIAALNHRGTLTVSDAAGAAEQGAMIQFVTENNHIRLRINVEAARAAGLTISSKLLRPAEIVSAPKD
jgi:hypothetical protein